MKKMKLVIAMMASLALIAAACSSDSSTDTDEGDSSTEQEESSADQEESTDEDESSDADEAEESSEATSDSGTWDLDAALAADPACDDPVTGNPLVIGYAADFSDLGGFADAPASAAAEHFAQQVNCSGGVDGRPLEVVIRDISGDPETTALAAQELIDAGSVAMLGPPFPDFGFPLLQVTEGNVAVIFTASTEPSLSDTSALSYLAAFDDTQQATAAAEFALEQGWTTAVTFSAPGPYFGYNPEIFTEVFTEGGGTVISDFNFAPIDDVDFSSQVNEIAVGDAPDVVYSAMLSFQLTALKGQMEGAGVETNYISTDAFEATGGYFGDNIEGIYHTTHAFPTANDGRVTTLDESFAEATGSASESPTFAALAVDGIAVIIDAYLRAGSDDPAAVGAAIAEAADVQGATGVLSYNGTGTPTKPIYVHQVVDGAPSLAATIGG
jgi:branched-chain amino acid transport system substrate-binding protein